MLSIKDFGIDIKYYQNIIEYMIKSDAKLLGEGRFSKVYSLNSMPDMAFRVSKHADNFMRYASLIETADNPIEFQPHFPSVFDMAITEDGASICLVEKLKKAENIINNFNNFKMYIDHEVDLNKISPKFRKQAFVLRELIYYIKDYMYIKNNIDIHPGNFMLRKGNIILNDPIYGNISLYNIHEIFERSTYYNVFPSFPKSYEKMMLNKHDPFAEKEYENVERMEL